MTADNHLEQRSVLVRRESERRAAKRLVIVAAIAVPRDPRGAEHTLPAALSAPAACEVGVIDDEIIEVCVVVAASFVQQRIPAGVHG